MTKALPSLLSSLLLIASVGCGDDDGVADSSTADSSVSDSGSGDAASMDSSVADTGPDDAAASDSAPMDSTVADGASDSAVTDASTEDTAMPDATFDALPDAPADSGPDTAGLLATGTSGCTTDDQCVEGVCWDFHDYDSLCGGTVCSTTCTVQADCQTAASDAGAGSPVDASCGSDGRCNFMGTGLGSFFCT
ncbi:MAG: hypothetical protein JRH11_09375 [Deltaproteobacteria bacterium]|nr:hypothetical protein [Deltaproteobacteria bacterium]